MKRILVLFVLAGVLLTVLWIASPSPSLGQPDPVTGEPGLPPWRTQPRGTTEGEPYGGYRRTTGTCDIERTPIAVGGDVWPVLALAALGFMGIPLLRRRRPKPPSPTLLALMDLYQATKRHHVHPGARACALCDALAEAAVAIVNGRVVKRASGREGR